MEDRLQDVAVGIGDVSILPIVPDAVGRAVPVPEAQRAGTSRYRELLVEGAVSSCLASRETAEAIRCVAHESRKSAAVRLGVGYHGRCVGILNYPRWKIAGLESLVLD